MQFIQGLHRQDTSGGADGVTQRYAAAVGVGPVQRQIEIADYCQGLGGKCLVEFEYIDVPNRQPGFSQHHFNGGYRSDAHVFRFDPGVGIGDEPAHRLHAQSFGGTGIGQDHRSGGVVYPGCVASGDAAVFLENSAQLGKLFYRHIRPHVFVPVE